MLDTIIQGGLVFDGYSGEPKQVSLGIQDHRIVELSEQIGTPAAKRIDATGHYVMPSFILPCLLPVRGLEKQGNTFGVDSLIVPSHVDTSMLSGQMTCYELTDVQAVRVAAMGEARASQTFASMTELERLKSAATEILCGDTLGIIINLADWALKFKQNDDYYDARHDYLAEFQVIANSCRQQHKVLQLIVNPKNLRMLRFILKNSSALAREALKLNILFTVRDDFYHPILMHAIEGILEICRLLLRANVRFQFSQIPPVLESRGVHSPLIAELKTGQKIYACPDQAARRRLWLNKIFSEQFQSEWLLRKIKHYPRDLSAIMIEDAPDKSLVGRSLRSLAAEQGERPMRLWANLLAEFDDELLWCYHYQAPRRQPFFHSMLPAAPCGGRFRDNLHQAIRACQSSRSLARVIQSHTSAVANAYGLGCVGQIALNYQANINVIHPNEFHAALPIVQGV